MISVYVNIIPRGFKEFETQLKRVEIINDGSGTKTTGNYIYRIRDKNDRIYKEGVIKKFKRKKYNALHLLQLVLKDAGYELDLSTSI